MIGRLALTRLILLGVVLGMAGLAALGYVMQRNDLRTLQDLSKENIIWSSAQLEVELYRFMNKLMRLEAGGDHVSPDDVIDRFDILWSRVAIYSSGDVAERLNRYDAETRIVPSLFDTMKAQEEAVMSLQDGDSDAIYALLSAFQPYVTSLRKLTVAVVIGEEKRAGDARGSMREGQFLASTLSVGAVVLSVLLIAVAFFEARKYRRLAERNAELARAADAASRAKSRFLTMMSHELRTPMNGVLGQIALAKLPGPEERRGQLLAQAERSGRQMIGMLTDILDFSAMQEDRLSIERSVFSMKDFASDLGAYFASAVAGGGRPLVVECAAGAPAQIIADANRIRQSLIHLAVYVLDTAGASDARIDIDHEDGDLIAILSFKYQGAGEEEWRPDMLLGEPQRSDEQFASDALGPMVARGLIEAMGGRLELASLGDPRTAVRLRLPAEVAREAAPMVRLEASSMTMRLVCEAALKACDARLAEDGVAPDEVDIAFLEVGAADDLSKLEALRRQYPRARVLALGRTTHPDLFDGVAPVPLKADALRHALNEQALAA